MKFRIVIISIHVAFLAEMKYAVSLESNVPSYEKLKRIISNPLKYARSFFYSTKPQKKETIYSISRSIREIGVLTKDSRLHHHYILINKPARISCTNENTNSINISVVWEHLDENQIVQAPGHYIDSSGHLDIENVQFSDMGDYTCLVPGRQIKIYIHRVSVISMPKTRIKVKIRYTTKNCEDSTRSGFEKAMIRLLGHQVCYTSICHIVKMEASCQNRKKKREYFFETEMVFDVYLAPTEKCGITCTSKNMDQEVSEIRQAIKRDVLKYGEVTIPTGTFSFRPQVITYFSTSYYCDPDFVLSSDYCEPCKPGTIFVNNKCNQCPLDSYNSHFGSRRCYACPEDKETFVVGSTSVEQCISRNSTATIFAIIVLICLLVLKILVLVGIKMYFSKKKPLKSPKPKENDVLIVAEGDSESNTKKSESPEVDEGSLCREGLESVVALSTSSESSNQSQHSSKTCNQSVKRKKHDNKVYSAGDYEPRTANKGTCTSEDKLNSILPKSLKVYESGPFPTYAKKHAKNLRSDIFVPGTSDVMSQFIPAPPPLPGKNCTKSKKMAINKFPEIP